MYDYKAVESKVRSYWEENNIPQRLAKIDFSKPKFYLLDGPPYVNAEPHVGHVKTTVFKDAWSKFKLMQGFSSWFQPGFDCHGLPIENMVEREIGVESKKDIVEKIGVEKFMQLCKKKAKGNEKIWLELYKKLGAWRGYVKPYMTLENYYIESAWWTIKQIAEKGLLYQGEKPTYWCPHCQTALAGYEVTDSYQNLTDPYVYVKFPVEGKENEYLVIFTTTPWTLVSNVALAVKGDETYVKVKVGNEHLILAEKRVKPVLEELCKLQYTVEERFPGEKLKDLKYKPVLDVPMQKIIAANEKAHRVYLSIPVLKSKSYKHGVLEKVEEMKEEFFDFVNIEEGSGIVHVATGHGPEDYYLGQHYELPLASPVDDEGRFTEDAGKYQGMFVLGANKQIVEELKEKGYLLYSGKITHAYPVCWRCKTPLIFRLTKQWFIAIDPLKSKMLEEIENVRWLPDFGKQRFRNWVKEATDWCISRQRYWGIPLPIWVCENCKHTEVIGSVKELREKATVELPKKIDLHKNFVDKVELKCPKCGGIMRRVPDIIDVWFDSGIAPWASLGYPYKNKKLFKKLWPVDLVDESQDQIRGWFYSLMFTSVAVFGQAPYKAVAINGWVLDEKGEKMSKSKGNYVSGADAYNMLGADALRLYYFSGNYPWEQQNFSINVARDLVRALDILWNTLQFYKMYSFENFEPRLENLKTEDKWLLSRINSVVKGVSESMENFEFNKAGKLLTNFIVEDLSRFYVKLIRDRVWINAKDEDKIPALSTLYTVLLKLSKLLAPITPFISEYVYQELEGKWNGKSVYECKWPSVEFVDEELEEEVEKAREIVQGILAARQKAGIKLRWPLKHAKINAKVDLEKVGNIIKVLANVDEVSIGEEKEWIEAETKIGKVYVDARMDEELVDRALFRELVRTVQELRKKNGFKVSEKIALSIKSDEDTESRLERFLEPLMEEVGAESIVLGELRGKFQGELQFFDKKVEIMFDAA